MKNAAIEQGLEIPLMEEFYTLQGEGFHSGKAAWFIRLGGCDVGCHWCDVKESWDPKIHPLTPTDLVVANAKKNPSGAVVVTGGEPCMYNLGYLTRELRRSGIKTYLETSGAYPISGEWDWICFSPKKNSPPLPGIFKTANELKVIIYNADDFKWAEIHAAGVEAGCNLYLQPEWSRREEMVPKITDYVMGHPKWKISLQTHKYLGIP